MKAFLAGVVCFAVLAAVAPPARAEEPATPDTAFVSWFNKIKLSGTLDGDLRWMRHGDLSSGNAISTSDLYIRMIEIGIQTSFLAWTSATAVPNSGWMGDPMNLGDE